MAFLRNLLLTFPKLLTGDQERIFISRPRSTTKSPSLLTCSPITLFVDSSATPPFHRYQHLLLSNITDFSFYPVMCPRYCNSQTFIVSAKWPRDVAPWLPSHLLRGLGRSINTSEYRYPNINNGFNYSLWDIHVQKPNK